MNNIKFIDANDIKSDMIKLEKPGLYTVFLFNHQGRVKIEIKHSKINVQILGIYIGKGKDSFSLQTTQHHIAKNSISNLLVRGIFFDQSSFDYHGLIHIDKKAQLSHAYQKNQNIIMGKGCHIESKPFLEIKANDVFCTHGSTTGKLSSEQIYYLQTRGLTKNKAALLLLRGFISSVFETLVSQNINETKINFYKEKAFALLPQ